MNTVTTETATVETAPATIVVPAFNCTTAHPLTTKKGTERGTRYMFMGGESARDIRNALKAKGSKGKALDKAVNACLRGHATLSQQLAHAFVVSESARGVVWEMADSLKRGAALKGVFAPEKSAKPAKPAKPAKATPVDVKAAAAALSAEDMAALVADLTARIAAKAAAGITADTTPAA